MYRSKYITQIITRTQVKLKLRGPNTLQLFISVKIESTRGKHKEWLRIICVHFFTSTFPSRFGIIIDSIVHFYQFRIEF